MRIVSNEKCVDFSITRSRTFFIRSTRYVLSSSSKNHKSQPVIGLIISFFCAGGNSSINERVMFKFAVQKLIAFFFYPNNSITNVYI